MILTEDWMNGVSVVVVALSLARAWVVTSQPVDCRKAERDRVMLLMDGYLLPHHTQRNRAEIERGDMCGCLCCEQTFQTREIHQWVEADRTAVCPRCGADMVVGSAAGFAITPELLRRAHQVRFDASLSTPSPRWERQERALSGRGRSRVVPSPLPLHK